MSVPPRPYLGEEYHRYLSRSVKNHLLLEHVNYIWTYPIVQTSATAIDHVRQITAATNAIVDGSSLRIIGVAAAVAVSNGSMRSVHLGGRAQC